EVCQTSYHPSNISRATGNSQYGVVLCVENKPPRERLSLVGYIPRPTGRARRSTAQFPAPAERLCTASSALDTLPYSDAQCKVASAFGRRFPRCTHPSASPTPRHLSASDNPSRLRFRRSFLTWFSSRLSCAL